VDYYDDSISFLRLWKALKRVCRGSRWKKSVSGYETNGVRNTIKLVDELREGSHKIGSYLKFLIFEPKLREILASRIQDRQIQRALRDAGLYDDIVEHLIRNNVACQTGRGTSDAFARLKILLRHYYRRFGCIGWVLQCDIRKYFPSTSHEIAKKFATKYISDERACRAVHDIIDSFDGDTGLGLGCEITQLLELLVLNDLDHFIKEKLRIKYYIRYMDDFVLISDSKEHLQYCLIEIRRYLNTIGFELNKKTSIYPLKQGIIFLKWRFLLTSTGKVLMLIDKKKIYRERYKLRTLVNREKDGKLTPGTAYASLQSFLASAQQGNAHRVCTEMIQYYNSLWTEEQS
jgi:retron-type reverse transcriptase